MQVNVFRKNPLLQQKIQNAMESIVLANYQGDKIKENLQKNLLQKNLIQFIVLVDAAFVHLQRMLYQINNNQVINQKDEVL